MISLSHLNEFVLHSLFFVVPVAPVHHFIREGDFLASICPEDSWALLWLLSVGMVGQFVDLCFSTVTYTPVFTWVTVVSPWAPFHGFPLFGYLSAVVLASLGSCGHKCIQDLLSRCHSLGIVLKNE